MADEAPAQNTPWTQNPRVRIGMAIVVPAGQRPVSASGCGGRRDRSRPTMREAGFAPDADRGSRERHVDENQRQRQPDGRRRRRAGRTRSKRLQGRAVEKASRRTRRRRSRGDRDAAATCRSDDHHLTASNVTTARGGIAQGGRPASRRRRSEASRRRRRRLTTSRRPVCARPKPTPPSRRVTSSGCAACSPRTKSRSHSSRTPLRWPLRGSPEGRRSTLPGRRWSRDPEAGIRVAESKLVQAKAGEEQAHAELRDGADRTVTAGRHAGARRGVRRSPRPAGESHARAGGAQPAIHHRESASPRSREQEGDQPGSGGAGGTAAPRHRGARRCLGDGQLQGRETQLR